MAKTDGTSKSLRAPAKEKQTPLPEGAVTLTIDGRDYVLDPSALSARDEDRLRAVTKSKLTLQAVMGSLFSGEGGLSDIAALAYLAECQAGRSPVWDTLAGSITATSDVQFDVVQADADPE